MKLNPNNTSGSSPGSVPLFLRPRALRPPAAADYLATTPFHVEELMRDGVLPFRVLGKARVIAVEDLDTYLDSLPKQNGKLAVPKCVEREIPRAGAAVRFAASKKTPFPGQLPAALNAESVEPEADGDIKTSGAGGAL